MPNDTLIAVLIGLGVAVASAALGALAVRVQALPDVIDFTIIPTAAGFFGLLAALIGAVLRFPPDRLGRVTLFGNLIGVVFATLGLVLALLLGA